MLEDDPTAQNSPAEVPEEGVDSVPPLDLAKHALEGAGLDSLNGLDEGAEHDTGEDAPSSDTPEQPPSTQKRAISKEEAERLAKAAETPLNRDRLQNVQDMMRRHGGRRPPGGRSSGRRSPTR